MGRGRPPKKQDANINKVEAELRKEIEMNLIHIKAAQKTIEHKQQEIAHLYGELARQHDFTKKLESQLEIQDRYINRYQIIIEYLQQELDKKAAVIHGGNK